MGQYKPDPINLLLFSLLSTISFLLKQQNFYKAYSPRYHCESPDPVRILLGLSDPNNLLFHPNNQRKSQILSW